MPGDSVRLVDSVYRVALLLVTALLWLASAQTSPKPTPKKAGAKSTSSTRKGTPAKRASAKEKSKSSKVAGFRAGPQKPSKERYLEMEQALASKGYLAGEPTGLWSVESVDALKRFQREQNLKEHGKIDSLSLIALGLGPPRTVPKPARPPE